ncbi:RNA polymerase sigma factor [Amycolatopsis roodepoortensis]|uniref:RNA polymerase sigma factor (Sigma-70 family) n=1 Tax=Amycolatopsis roodepoortensis TaxID=700274 RepID=A0ABR9LIR4_9PSEU|nr:sigma-70 family RNA polymerase sigma factor [Amycolatopsis roodepoortensis]MBE1580554.1 RNA polymerase sigma factor (sigma-70 family) [Amycolatopsis roodepoortensis]
MTKTYLDDPACIIERSTSKDMDLIAAVRAGDSEAYGILFQRHHAAALRYARKHTRSCVVAEDAVMDAFIAIFLVLQGQNGPRKKFRRYLFRTVRNAVGLNWRDGRHLLLVPSTEDVLHGASPSPETIVHDRADAVEQRERADAALSQLPDRWRQVLHLTTIAKRPIGEVAKIFGLSPNATSALAGRARRGYRERFRALSDDAA